MDKVIGKEFVHGYRVKAKYDGNRKLNDDTLVVKEKIHYESGKIVPNLVVYKDYKRPFWITKKYYRNHKQKKEWEYLDRLDMHYANDSELVKEIMRKLEKPAFGKINYRDVCKSPYVYGSDVSSLVLLKDQYRKKYNLLTPLTSAFYDIENHPDTKVISISSASRRTSDDRIEVFAVINVSALKKKVPNLAKAVKYALLENLPDDLPKGFKPEMLHLQIVTVESEGDLILKFWKKMHQWGTDILASWSTHDIATFIDRMKELGLDPATILTDPDLPPELRDVYIKKDRTVKVTQSGKETIVDPEKQWHLYRSPARFYILDLMATYYYNRRGGKEVVGGYSLQNLLTKVLGYGKLKFKELTTLTDKYWHIYMLENHPVEYFAYNIWDELGMLFFNDVTKDTTFLLPTLVNRSLFDSYGLSSRLILDDFHFYALENNAVLGTQVVGEDFGEGLGRDDWTVTLHPWMRAPTGKDRIIFEEGLLPNNIGFGTADEDVESAYPNATILMGLSKQTSKREVVNISGRSMHDIKRSSVSLLTGEISHGGYMRLMCSAPGYSYFYNKAKE